MPLRVDCECLTMTDKEVRAQVRAEVSLEGGVLPFLVLLARHPWLPQLLVLRLANRFRHQWSR